jgi:hypothetical protein
MTSGHEDRWELETACWRVLGRDPAAPANKILADPTARELYKNALKAWRVPAPPPPDGWPARELHDPGTGETVRALPVGELVNNLMWSAHTA